MSNKFEHLKPLDAQTMGPFDPYDYSTTKQYINIMFDKIKELEKRVQTLEKK